MAGRKFGVLAAVFLLGVLCAAGPAQSATIYYSGNHAYQLVTGSFTWEAAHTAAGALTDLGLSWHLATITSSAENLFLLGLVVTERGFSLQDLWIGGRQATSSPSRSSGWSWVTGEPWAYTNWGPPEPNDCSLAQCGGAEHNAENYLGFAVGRYDYFGRWHDAPLGNGFNTGYLAEAVVPIPGAVWLLGGGLAGLALIRRRASR